MSHKIAIQGCALSCQVADLREHQRVMSQGAVALTDLQLAYIIGKFDADLTKATEWLDGIIECDACHRATGNEPPHMP